MTIDFQETPGALLISEFRDCLTRGVTKPRNELPLSLLYERKYDLCFTHPDLHRSNLFVTRGRLSGISIGNLLDLYGSMAEREIYATFIPVHLMVNTMMD